MNVRLNCTFAICLLLPAPPLMAQVAAPATPAAPADLSHPQALLIQAGAANNLDDLTQPWHLKASYEISAKGTILDIGTFEEWHLDKYRWKRSYTSDHYKQTEYRTPDGRYFSSDAGEPPWPESLVTEELVHPIPTPVDNVKTPPPKGRPLVHGPIKLDCLSMEPTQLRISAPLGFYPAYCFNPGSTMLRLRLDAGSLQGIRNQMAQFHNVFVAKDIVLLKQGSNFLHIRLSELENLSSDQVAAVSFPTPSKLALPDNFTLPEGTVIGKKLSGPNPQYPDAAKQKRVTGAVLLLAHVGTDGHLSDVRVVSSPDESLSAASLAAVEKWIYQPFTLKGTPIDVETEVRVVYQIGP